MVSGDVGFAGRLADEKGDPSPSTTVSGKSSIRHEKGQQESSSDEVKIDLDFGQVQIRSRTNWWKIWYGS